MEFTKKLNSLSETEFTSIFGSVFEKSEWIANEAFKQKPFKNSGGLRLLGVNLSPEKTEILKLAGVERGLDNNVFKG